MLTAAVEFGRSALGERKNPTLPVSVQRSWLQEVVYALLVAGAALLALSPVLVRSGWPFNQGTTAPLLLVQIYAAHLRHFDLFPVWSSSDGIGMGSPVLLFYHRTFFYIAGLIFAFGGSLKFSVVATLFVFLVFGAYGMRFALSLVTTSKLLCAVGSLGFLFTNYTFTDWLDPRGDLAEFTALMIVPWLLWWCLELVKHRRVSYLLIPVMVVLVNSHSAIALTSLFSVFIALALFILGSGWSGLRRAARRLIVVACGTTIILVPLIIAQLRFLRFYDPQTKNVLDFKVANQFVSFGRYFYDGAHRWYAANQLPPHFNFVQIDFAIWVPIAAAAASAAIYWIAAGRRRGRSLVGREWAGSVMVFLITSLGVYTFLQLRISYGIYEVLAPLKIINFPWRMLAFITPLGVLVVMGLADRLRLRYPMRSVWVVLSLLWLGALIFPSPVTSRVPNFYDVRIGPDFHSARQLLATPGQWPPMSLFQVPTSVDYRDFSGFVIVPPQNIGGLYNVFLPKVIDAHGDEVKNVSGLYANLHQHQSGAQSLSSVRCTVAVPQDAEFESLQLTFSVACSAPTKLALPVSVNPSSTVLAGTSSRTLRRIPYFHRAADPRMIVDVRNEHETIVVNLPTLWGTLF